MDRRQMEFAKYKAQVGRRLIASVVDAAAAISERNWWGAFWHALAVESYMQALTMLCVGSAVEGFFRAQTGASEPPPVPPVRVDDDGNAFPARVTGDA